MGTSERVRARQHSRVLPVRNAHAVAGAASAKASQQRRRSRWKVLFGRLQSGAARRIAAPYAPLRTANSGPRAPRGIRSRGVSASRQEQASGTTRRKAAASPPPAPRRAAIGTGRERTCGLHTQRRRWRDTKLRSARGIGLLGTAPLTDIALFGRGCGRVRRLRASFASISARRGLAAAAGVAGAGGAARLVIGATRWPTCREQQLYAASYKK